MGPCELTRLQTPLPSERRPVAVLRIAGFAILSTSGRYSPAGRPFHRHPLRKYSTPRRQRRGQRYHAEYNERGNMARWRKFSRKSPPLPPTPPPPAHHPNPPPPTPNFPFPTPPSPPYFRVATQVWGFLSAALACDVRAPLHSGAQEREVPLGRKPNSPPILVLVGRALPYRRKLPRIRREPRPFPSLH